MISLHRRLFWLIATSNTVLALVVFFLLWGVAKSVSRSELDRSLESEIRTLANMCRTDELGETYLDVDATVMPWYSPGPDCEYFRLTRADGHLVQLSTSLGGTWGLATDVKPAMDPAVGVRALPEFDLRSGELSFADLRLPDGRPGRVAGLRTRALADWDPLKPPAKLPELSELDLVVARDRVPERTILAMVLPTGLFLVIAWPIMAAALAWWLLRRGLRPLVRLGQEVEKLDPARAGSMATVGAQVDELAPIVARINGLLSRVDATLERERRFAGMAAHELRTPLAGLAAAIEVAAAWPDDRPIQERLHHEGLAELRRMQRQIDSLLFIARGHVVAGGSTVDFASALSRCIAARTALMKERSVSVSVTAPASAIVHGTDELVVAILDNVCGNLVAHAPVGCTAMCTLVKTGAVWRLSFSNPAPDLTAMDMQRLAEPWFRKGAAQGHAGLGLTIAKTAAEALGGTFNCTLVDGQLSVVVELRQA